VRFFVIERRLPNCARLGRHAHALTTTTITPSLSLSKHNSAASPAAPITNFEAALPSSHYAELYKAAGLTGGHVIMLGADAASAAAARAALAAFPGGLQVGGGVTPDTAPAWIDAGAAAVIVTSYIFVNGVLDEGRLDAMVRAVGRDRLVLDLSCRRRPKNLKKDGKNGGEGGDDGEDDEYVVVADRWQTFTDTPVTPASLAALGAAAGELLVHGVDVEGMRLGVDSELVELLGKHCPVPATYAGGVATMVSCVGFFSACFGVADSAPRSSLCFPLTLHPSILFHSLSFPPLRPTWTPSRPRREAGWTSPSAARWTSLAGTCGSRRWWPGRRRRRGGRERESVC
jgi:phosphoribosylformimino-5-aminoimidazole carboxamide ribotide isomerase